MKYGIYTAEGDRRTNNEDFVIADHELGLFIVCDGMGGHAAGEYASLQAGNFLLQLLKEKLTHQLTEREVLNVLTSAIDRVNRHIYALSQEDSAYNDMGTTALMTLFRDRRLFICHVGDSRAYLVDSSGAKLLTRDQSYVQKLVEEGQITAEEARIHPKRNIILQAIGSNQKLDPELLVRDYTSDQVVVLCSDGVSDALTEDDIYNVVMAAQDNQAAARQLVEMAFNKGSRDDSTAVVVGDLALISSRVNK